MSQVKVQGDPSGTGIFTIASPNSNSNYTLTLPETSGTLLSASGGALPVSQGGTGATSQTAYAVICGGTTSTGAYQSVASVGTAGQVLTSNGAGALPTFQTVSGGVTSFNTRTGAVTLSSGDVTTALGFTPAAQPSTNGLVTRTSAGNYSGRTITAGTGISVSNGDGVSGNPTITNSGVTSIVAGSNISISGATGAVTINASSSAPTTGQVQSAMAGSNAGDVGTWGLFSDMTNSTTNLAAGSTIAGSVLRYSGYATYNSGSGDVSIFVYSGTPSGTWRLMGYLPRGAATSVGGVGSLWLRIS